jgi:arylsulfatase
VVSAAEPDLKRPNILLILADDMGWSDVGCYGGEIATPNLDGLAQGGLRFTQFYNTSKCFPSRACLLTGVYAQQCGMDKGPGNLANAVTLGEVLRTAGYHTLWSGKHHGTENPYTRGFDHYFGLRDGACNYFNPGLQRPGEGKPAQKAYGKRFWCIDGKTLQPYTPEEKDFYTTDYFTKHAMDWLDELQKADPNGQKPFFLYMAYNAPHDPLMAWPEDIAKYEGKYMAGYEAVRTARYQRQVESGLIDPKVTPLSERDGPDWDGLSAEKKKEEDRKMAVYAAMVDRMDQNVGKVLAKVKAMGRQENTLVLFCSDNGGSAEVVNLKEGSGEIGSMTRWTSVGGAWANVSNTPLRKFKNYSHEGGICTPLIVRWPALIKKAGLCHRPGHFIDLMATFVDITGAKYPEESNGRKIVPMQGQSLLPAFKGEESVARRPIFWQWSKGKAVRVDPWKLVRYGDKGDWELYDISADRTETKNQAAQHADKVKELSALWEQWYASCGK